MLELAPDKLTPQFKEALEESKEANGVWMYKTLGVIFSRYQGLSYRKT